MNGLKQFIGAAALCFVAGQTFAVEGDADAGAKVFKKCAACHKVDEAKNKVGPHLVGIVDRTVASVEGYKYSSAMTAFGEGEKTWDEAMLREYLANPRAAVKGTRMAFVGLKKEEDLDNIIAYLKTFPAE
ncbi:c-type cytochrome [Ahrensia kielensis]|uniref:c-type cytochrome n=1 Tax=Ahrensia kielensis TaxID=76980 RepID=UPI0003793648|nr:cytochrome c family protein [Ahrensia kielensis]